MIQKIRIIFVLVVLAYTSFGQPLTIEQVRDMYFGGWDGQCGATELSQTLSKINSNIDPVLMAYKGAAISTTANCRKMPFAKWNTFNEGKALIEQAVTLAPENIEVRFLRFTVQSNIPGFLNYNHLVEDRQFLLNSVKTVTLASKSDNLKKLILIFLLDSGQLEKDEQMMIEQILAKH
ncbi:MAG: hypothetical protein ACNA7V_13805 [Bacteroidales bacterium]